LCLAALLDTIDVTVVNVAMPAIKDSLHFSVGGLAWMVNAYMVPFGGFLLLAGRAGDMLGRRRVLLAGTVVFTVASIASGLAPSAGVIVATRAVEGLAAAFVVPMTLALLSVMFPAGPARTRAFSVWGGISAAAGTLGLILGGLLVSTIGWRGIFFINVPVGALVLVLTLRVLPPDGERKPGGFDLGGALAVTGGASLLAYVLVREAWRTPVTVVSLIASVALLGYFVVHERFVASHPLLPASLLRNRSVTGANVIGVLFSSAIFAMFYSTTLYMQQVLGYSALRTGLAYLPLGVSILVAAGISPVLVRVLGVRIASVAGALLAVAGLLLLARIQVDGRLLTDILVPETLVGLGGGMILVPTSIASMSGAGAGRSGIASALMNASRQLGGAIGFAAISAVVASRAGVLELRGTAVPAAMTAGFRTGFVVSAALVAASAIAAITLLRETGRGERVNLIDLETADA
jgi:EmrB/QacA subfamily drug resistance transporter